MMYLIGQLAVWLLLTAAFAAVAGWAYAAQSAAPEQQGWRREREHLLRDIARLAGDGSSEDAIGEEREREALRRLIEVRDGRIAELEHSLEAARARADESAGRIAELERAPRLTAAEQDEVARLRALVAQHEEDRAREVEVLAEPAQDRESEAELQGWRLRYFEQRVRYLEGLNSKKQERGEDDAPPPLEAWRAREANARAAFLEQELRTQTQMATDVPSAATETEAFAADADVDALMRWRLLYLERRVGHLQARRPLAPQISHPAGSSMDEAELWKWRARYLESRLRRRERESPTIMPKAAPVVVAQPKLNTPSIRPQRPPTLPAARDGAPDDFTLIEDVSVLQQTTLYSIGVFHFDQIANWSEAQIAWVDHYLRLRGRIDTEEWVEQARQLAERGVKATRRARASAEA